MSTETNTALIKRRRERTGEGFIRDKRIDAIRSAD
jgi:hypothetical protein